MKKNLMALALAGIAIVCGTVTTNAQVSSGSSTPEYQVSRIDEDDIISPKAIKDFTHAYKSVKNEKWMITKDGFIVRFVSEGIKNSISYDKKGKWVASIKYYSEERLARDIRHIVKSTYYDYSIIGILEVETIDSHGVPTYVINMQSNTQIKTLRVSAGNMEVWKEYDRSGQ